MEKNKKTLLQKFEIPLNHLDFAYIADCKNAREMEKIVQILRSGEEGHYPDLTRCAEDKLRELKPNSRLFRYEEPLQGRDCLSSNEWKPIYDWTDEIKVKDKKLDALKHSNTVGENNEELAVDVLPPIRNPSKIKQQTNDDTSKATDEAKAKTSKKVERIRSTDYRKWDQYDPDVELLRDDLAEERTKEEIERKNRLNTQKQQLSVVNQNDDNEAENEKKQKLLSKLTDMEREHLAEEHRLRGNDYFRAKEYDLAIGEYTRAIQISPDTAAPAYNNRAIAKIKQQKFLEAIADCEECLKLEPNNLKAILRLAEANYGYGRRRKAYDLYLKVLKLDTKNAVALKAIAELRSQLGELPPENATRIQIQEGQAGNAEATRLKQTDNEYRPQQQQQSAVNTVATKKCDVQSSTNKSTTNGNTKLSTKAAAPKAANYAKNYDLAELVRPNRVVKSKLATAAEAYSNLTKTTQLQQQHKATNKDKDKTMRARNDAEAVLRLPQSMKTTEKFLIEEI